MYTKKAKADISLFATENEFHTLLTIHNDIRNRIYKYFPHLKIEIINTLFSILSSQALLYDQIIRKSTLLQGSVTKQSQIAKLVQGNRNNFEVKIHEHLNSFSIPFNQASNATKEEEKDEKGKEQKQEASMMSPTKAIVSEDECLHFEQESIISKIKNKMKLEKPQHIRTNSCYLTTNLFEQEELKLKEKEDKSNTILYQNEETLHKNRKIKLQLDKSNSAFNHPSFYQSNQNAHSALLSLTQLRCLTERKNTEREPETEEKPKRQNVLLSYQSFPKTEEKDYKRAGSKPSKYAKYLLKKYQDIVDSYEKIETDEDDSRRLNTLHSKMLSKNDVRKKEENEKSAQSFTIIEGHKYYSAQKKRVSSYETSKLQKKNWK